MDGDMVGPTRGAGFVLLRRTLVNEAQHLGGIYPPLHESTLDLVSEPHRLQGESWLLEVGNFCQGRILAQCFQSDLDGCQEVAVRHRAKAPAAGFAVPADARDVFTHPEKWPSTAAADQLGPHSLNWARRCSFFPAELGHSGGGFLIY